MGYAGGTKKNPTYHSLGDHTETVQIDYDPERISYQELLDIFWESHNPARPAWSRQYRSVILFANEEQERLARESRDRTARRLGTRINTEILCLERFYCAEDYHQKYRLQQHKAIMAALREIYPRMKDLVDSTAAAKLNAYLSGHLSHEKLEQEITDADLLPETVQRLLKEIKASAPLSCSS